jgi:hypothetical protein
MLSWADSAAVRSRRSGSQISLPTTPITGWWHHYRRRRLGCELRCGAVAGASRGGGMPITVDRLAALACAGAMTFGPPKPGFRPWARALGAMQREHRLRGDRGSWTGRSAGETRSREERLRGRTADRLDGDPQGPDPGNAGEGRPPRRPFFRPGGQRRDSGSTGRNAAVGLAGQQGRSSPGSGTEPGRRDQ